MMSNLIKYSDNYLETSGRLWKYYKEEPFIYPNGAIIDVTAINASFKFKQKITG